MMMGILRACPLYLVYSRAYSPSPSPNASRIAARCKQPISYMAGIAADMTLSGADLRQLRIQLMADAGAALPALLVATTLSVYKPRGMTSYGRRKQREQRPVSP